MKNILIIYPHWPPSNLAGVHRARLIANHTFELGWQTVILTVHSDYYEEKNDWDLLKTVSEKIEVHYVKAYKVMNPRIFGDIGLRGFRQMKAEALKIIKLKKINFIWIPIPSFYTAVLGRIIHNKTKIPYGIDYIDPWIRDISNRKSFRSNLSNFLAKLLEPYAIKKAALISGVSTLYFDPAIKRNFKDKQPGQVAMPYGFDDIDYSVKIKNIKYPWDTHIDYIPFIYAGAFLPKSDYFIRILSSAIKELIEEGRYDSKNKIFFIGTGNYFHKSISQYAIENKIDDIIIEIRKRYPYLEVINFLSAAKGVVLIGSTEEHYTASKTFQAILSKKPVFSILHQKSSAVQVLKDCKANAYLCEYNPNTPADDFAQNIKKTFQDFISGTRKYEPDIEALGKYSSKESARALIEAIEKVIV